MVWLLPLASVAAIYGELEACFGCLAPQGACALWEPFGFSSVKRNDKEWVEVNKVCCERASSWVGFYGWRVWRC